MDSGDDDDDEEMSEREDDAASRSIPKLETLSADKLRTLVYEARASMKEMDESDWPKGPKRKVIGDCKKKFMEGNMSEDDIEKLRCHMQTSLALAGFRNAATKKERDIKTLEALYTYYRPDDDY